MTPSHTKRRMAVMAKHGEPGWRIDRKYRGYNSFDNSPEWILDVNPEWDPIHIYRAVRVERTEGKRVPLPWSTIKCGMVVRWIAEPDSEYEITRVTREPSAPKAVAGDTSFHPHNRIHCEYLDGDAWKPLWTEEPGEEEIVEIVSEEEG